MSASDIHRSKSRKLDSKKRPKVSSSSSKRKSSKSSPKEKESNSTKSTAWTVVGPKPGYNTGEVITKLREKIMKNKETAEKKAHAIKKETKKNRFISTRNIQQKELENKNMVKFLNELNVLTFKRKNALTQMGFDRFVKNNYPNLKKKYPNKSEDKINSRLQKKWNKLSDQARKLYVLEAFGDKEGADINRKYFIREKLLPLGEELIFKFIKAFTSQSSEQYPVFYERWIKEPGISEDIDNTQDVDTEINLKELLEKKDVTEIKSAQDYLEWSREKRKDRDTAKLGLPTHDYDKFPKGKLLEVLKEKRQKKIGRNADASLIYNTELGEEINVDKWYKDLSTEDLSYVSKLAINDNIPLVSISGRELTKDELIQKIIMKRQEEANLVPLDKYKLAKAIQRQNPTNPLSYYRNWTLDQLFEEYDRLGLNRERLFSSPITPRKYREPLEDNLTKKKFLVEELRKLERKNKKEQDRLEIEQLEDMESGQLQPDRKYQQDLITELGKKTGINYDLRIPLKDLEEEYKRVTGKDPEYDTPYYNKTYEEKIDDVMNSVISHESISIVGEYLMKGFQSISIGDPFYSGFSADKVFRCLMHNECSNDTFINQLVENLVDNDRTESNYVLLKSAAKLIVYLGLPDAKIFRQMIITHYFTPKMLSILPDSVAFPEVFDYRAYDADTVHNIGIKIYMMQEKLSRHLALEVYDLINFDTTSRRRIKREQKLKLNHKFDGSKFCSNEVDKSNPDNVVFYMEDGNYFCFELDKLNDQFSQSNYYNLYTGKPFNQQFIDRIVELGKTGIRSNVELQEDKKDDDGHDDEDGGVDTTEEKKIEVVVPDKLLIPSNAWGMLESKIRHYKGITTEEEKKQEKKQEKDEGKNEEKYEKYKSKKEEEEEEEEEEDTTSSSTSSSSTSSSSSSDEDSEEDSDEDSDEDIDKDSDKEDSDDEYEEIKSKQSKSKSHKFKFSDSNCFHCEQHLGDMNHKSIMLKNGKPMHVHFCTLKCFENHDKWTH